MTKKVDRKLVINCLRLILFYIILSHAVCHLENLANYFNNEVKPEAKSGFNFVTPASSTGEAIASDFATFYACGLLNKDRIEKHLHINVYDPFLFTQAIARVAAPLKPQGTYCLQYPPIFLP